MKLYRIEVVEGYHQGFEPITVYQLLAETEFDVRNEAWAMIEDISSIVKVEEI